MVDRVRIIKYEAVPKCGSYEVRFSDGRPSKYFCWEEAAALERPTLSRGPKEIALRPAINAGPAGFFSIAAAAASGLSLTLAQVQPSISCCLLNQS